MLSFSWRFYVSGYKWTSLPYVLFIGTACYMYYMIYVLCTNNNYYYYYYYYRKVKRVFAIKKINFFIQEPTSAEMTLLRVAMLHVAFGGSRNVCSRFYFVAEHRCFMMAKTFDEAIFIILMLFYAPWLEYP